MIEIRSLKQFDKAKARASAGKLSAITSTLFRQYRVTNEETGAVYRVDFYRNNEGRRFATCECKGGQGGHICKHMAAALPLHLAIMLAAERREELKREGGRPPARFAPPTYNPAFDPDPADVAEIAEQIAEGIAGAEAAEALAAAA